MEGRNDACHAANVLGKIGGTDERAQSPFERQVPHDEEAVFVMIVLDDATDAEVHVGGNATIESQLGLARGETLFDRGLVDERVRDWLHELERAVADEDHSRDVGLENQRRLPFVGRR